MKRNRDWTGNARSTADELIMGPMGQQAAREGWIVGLWDHCRKNGALPNPYSVRTIKAEADKFNAAFASLKPTESALRTLGETMLKRRQRLTDMVLNGVVS